MFGEHPRRISNVLQEDRDVLSQQQMCDIFLPLMRRASRSTAGGFPACHGGTSEMDGL